MKMMMMKWKCGAYKKSPSKKNEEKNEEKEHSYYYTENVEMGLS
jgi:hypothetical protein